MLGFGMGFDNYVMNSDEIADTLIAELRTWVPKGHSVDEVIDATFRAIHANEDDLTDYDIDRVNAVIDEVR